MYGVFPIDNNGDLLSKSYLDTSTDANYVKFSDSTKDKLFVKGYSVQPQDGKSVS